MVRGTWRAVLDAPRPSKTVVSNKSALTTRLHARAGQEPERAALTLDPYETKHTVHESVEGGQRRAERMRATAD